MRLAAFFVLAGTAAFGAEHAVFTSGARMRVDRHQAEGTKIRLFNGSGYVEMEAALIEGFETDPPTAPATPPAMPAEAPSAAPAPAPLDYRALVDQAAEKYGLPKAFVRSVVKAESGFQPRAVSPKGAIGLMQLMPSTAITLGANPHDPAQNVDAGTRYLRDLLVRYNGGVWRALAAYNAGPDAVRKYGGVPPYNETLRYIHRVSREYAAQQKPSN